MTAYWCEQAWLGGGRPVEGVVLTVSGDRITSIDPGAVTSPAEATRFDGLTLPGFANAHSHAFHRALRGRTHAGGGTFWTWRDQMYGLAANVDPDVFEELATATFAEMVVAGYTCVGEFHYLHHGPRGEPYADPNEVGRRLINAAYRAGIRMTLLDTLYLHGGIGVEPNDVQRRFSDGSAYRWVDRVGDLAAVHSDRCRIGSAIHSVRAVDRHSMAVVAEWARSQSAVVHAHVSEQPQENAECVKAYGMTPVELLSDVGVLSAAFTAVHATHVTPGNLQHLATNGSRCCICPTTERELADGIGPTSAMRTAGIPLCLGSDAHAVIDPFEEMRGIELGQRLATLHRGTHQPVELLASATADGYASLGWDEGGTLAAGGLADFVTVGFGSVRLAGGDRADPLGAVVFAAAPPDVRHVVVAGRHVVIDGVHQRIDVASALDASITAAWKQVDR